MILGAVLGSKKVPKVVKIETVFRVLDQMWPYINIKTDHDDSIRAMTTHVGTFLQQQGAMIQRSQESITKQNELIRSLHNQVKKQQVEVDSMRQAVNFLHQNCPQLTEAITHDHAVGMEIMEYMSAYNKQQGRFPKHKTDMRRALNDVVSIPDDVILSLTDIEFEELKKRAKLDNPRKRGRPSQAALAHGADTGEESNSA